MEYLNPEDNYLVVFPDGRGVTFKDLEGCHSYINRYYEERIRLHAMEEVYENYDLTKEDARHRISTIIGAEEGDSKIYFLEDVFEAIQNSGAFLEEQEEVIGKLMGRNSKIDITDYGLDKILLNVTDIIEGRY